MPHQSAGNLNRRVEQTLYQLKREYGGTISIYQMGDATVATQSGVKTVPATSVDIKRAIILPAKIARETVKNISIISAGKSFIVGGNFDTRTRMFIVDRKDAPQIDLSESDYIIYRGRRYEIKNFEDYQFDKAWVIVGKQLDGELPSQIYKLHADNHIRLTIATTLA